MSRPGQSLCHARHALSQANNGGTIFMAAGSYSASSLMITKALTIDGPVSSSTRPRLLREPFGKTLLVGSPGGIAHWDEI